MFRNTLCEANRTNPGERSALRRESARESSSANVSRGSQADQSAQPDLAPKPQCRIPYLSYQPRGCAESSRREQKSKCRSSVFPRRIRRLWASRSYWRHGNRTDGCGSHPASAAGSSNRKNPVPASYENPLRTAQDDNRMPISTLSVPTARNRKAILNDVSASESHTVPSNDS